ncbi:SMC-Scp complex subunit ScpB [Liquorilactobacillus vini]|uniref:Segregation and condensation protein B n=1 Tax=Liquorilactobacillus vini DSM 20605 TaxID=1133569 RepID=A0A0R2CF23_9LACO|nr:SMC-Scp complex subunit ScpB [Liquorilactobacillus vini]KRM89698.1 segregation and condensation protein ScpB [Liquorilactobacillus vini DSM 20605]
MESNLAKIEALLFVSGDQGIEISELAELTGILKPAIYSQLELLQQKYMADPDASLFVLLNHEKARLATKKSFAPLLQAYFTAPNVTSLSRAAMETLAIIAYRQPVTRVQIEEIRGTSSSGALKRLQLLDLVREKGRLNVPGRPIIYVTTENFLDHFGLNSLDELPPFPQAEQLDLPLEADDLLELFNNKLENKASKENKENKEKEENFD